MEDRLKAEGDKKKNGALGIGRILRASINSAKGLRYAVLHEAAFQQELLAGILLMPLAFYMDISSTWKCLAAISYLFILVVELLNTAIEKAVDLASPSFSPVAGQAKDLGSAAVLLAMAAHAAVWAWAVFA